MSLVVSEVRTTILRFLLHRFSGKFGKIVNEKGEVLLDKKSSRAESAAEMAKTILELDHEGIRVVNKDDNIIAWVSSRLGKTPSTDVFSLDSVMTISRHCWTAHQKPLPGHLAGTLALTRRRRRIRKPRLRSRCV